MKDVEKAFLSFRVQQGGKSNKRRIQKDKNAKKKNVFQFVHYVQIFIKNIIILLHVERDVELGIGLLLIFPEYALLSLFLLNR